MGSFSDHWENEILDHIFGKGLYNATLGTGGSYPDVTIYVGLSTADPLDDASGLAEPVGNGYARVQTSASDWNAASAGFLDNTNELIFSEATGSWGTITHFVLFDAATAGNMLAHGALSQSRAIVSGDKARFAAGDLSVTLD
jgi:hypothetical protein